MQSSDASQITWLETMCCFWSEEVELSTYGL